MGAVVSVAASLLPQHTLASGLGSRSGAGLGVLENEVACAAATEKRFEGDAARVYGKGGSCRWVFVFFGLILFWISFVFRCSCRGSSPSFFVVHSPCRYTTTTSSSLIFYPFSLLHLPYTFSPLPRSLPHSLYTLPLFGRLANHPTSKILKQ